MMSKIVLLCWSVLYIVPCGLSISVPPSVRNVIESQYGQSVWKTTSQVTALDLSGLELEQINFIQLFPGLTSLDLSDNYLVDIMPLRHVPQLQALWVSKNFIRSIEVMEYLPQLLLLDAHDNNIERLPVIPPRLVAADFSRNCIEGALPVSYYKLALLDCRQNRIHFFPQPKMTLEQQWHEVLGLRPLWGGRYIAQNPASLPDWEKQVLSANPMSLGG
ncbi:MAG: hypothetical protein OXT67_01920 [Zetaproteobacteria bacterium]|nr:hypothetical protein [Zetaproteobacteria bacterium]